MLARLLQAITLSTVAAALLWLLVFWPVSPLLAVAGFALIGLGYALWLAAEFVALWRVDRRRDPTPRPSGAELLRAWWGEAITTPRVFCWRQPFRADQVLDQGEPGPGGPALRGVVLLHGFVCNRGLWTPWLRRLRAEGRVFVALDLEPVFGAIDGYVPQVEAAVARVTAATGLSPVLVCHSMGGLVARAWLRAMDADHRVHHVVTIGTPHQGTWMGRFSGAANGRQMRLDSAWLRELARQEPPGRAARFTCWYSNCDNIVMPSACATLPGARNRLVPGVAHVALAFCPQVMDATLQAIRLDRFEEPPPTPPCGPTPRG